MKRRLVQACPLLLSFVILFGLLFNAPFQLTKVSAAASPPNLSMYASASDPSPKAGESFDLSLVVTNTGDTDATNVVIQTVIPYQLQITNIVVNSGGVFYTATGQWAVGTVPAKGSVGMAIHVQANMPGMAQFATSVGSLDQTDSNPSDDSMTVNIDIQPFQADLGLSISVNDAAPKVGDTITYAETVTNIGPDDATNVSVNAGLPPGMTFISATPSQGSYDSGSGKWNVGTLPLGGSATLSIKVRVVWAGVYHYLVSIDHADQADPNAANNTVDCVVTVDQADVTVAVTASSTSPNVGDTVTFTATVTNNGTSAATHLALNGLLPAGLSFVSSNPEQGSYDSAAGVWRISSLAWGDATKLTITAIVVSPAVQTLTVNVGAADQDDPNLANNTASVVVTPQQADLAVTVTTSNAVPNAGDTVTYTATVTNNGPSSATRLTVFGLLPSGLTFGGAMAGQGSYDPASGVWTVGALGSGSSATLTITASVNASAAQTFIIGVGASDQFDPNVANNTASVGVTPQQADVAVTLAASDTAPNVGDSITYTATVTNNGPSAATNVAVDGLLPAGLTLTDSDPSQGSYDSTTGEWTVGTLASGDAASLTITASVDSSAVQTFTAAVGHADQADPNVTNNTASVVVTPQQADVAVTLSASDDTPNVGDAITYTATVTNNGPSAATNVAVDGLLPAGLTLTDSDPSQGSYDSATGEWTVGTLASGDVATLTITARVDSSAAQTITAAVGHADQADASTANNSASVVVTPQQADVAVTVATSDDAPNVGDSITYTTTVTNNGPSAATNVAVDGLLPAGLTLTDSDPSQGSYDSATGEWTVGTLATGDVATLTITARVDASAAQTFTAAVGHADQADANAANNTASGTINPLLPHAVTGMTIDRSAFTHVGGSVTVTITGTYLTGQTVELYMDGTAAAAADVTSDTSAAAVVSIPANHTTGDEEHILTVKLNGVEAADTQATVTTAPEPVNVPVNDPTLRIDKNGVWLDPSAVDLTKSSVTLSVAPSKDGMAYVGLPAKLLSRFASVNDAFAIKIETPYGSYLVPVNLASLIPGYADLLAAHHLSAEDIIFKITLSDKSGDTGIQAALDKRLPTNSVLGAIVDFKIELIDAKSGQPIATAGSFSQALTRIIPMMKTTDEMPAQWGAFRYNETSQTFEYIPARAVNIDGAWYVTMNSYTNSIYAVVENPVRFSDTKYHWADAYIRLVAAKGLVEGIGNGKYAPDKAVTRAEFTSMLVRAIGRPATVDSTAQYKDVQANAWYYDAVMTAKALGLLDFASGASFRPDQPITREEMASELAAVIALNKLPDANANAGLDGFKDMKSVNPAYLADVRLVVGLQIMNGQSAKTFDPRGVTTRAQAAAVLVRTLQALGMMDAVQ